MGLFRKKSDDDKSTLRFEVPKMEAMENQWQTITPTYEGADFLSLFFPAAVLDAAVTSVSENRRQGLLDEATRISSFSYLGQSEANGAAVEFWEANRSAQSSPIDMEYRALPNLSVPYFRNRDWVDAPPNNGAVVIECELVSGRSRSGVTTFFHPTMAATDDAMIELYRVAWDWMVVRSGAQEHDISIGELLVGGVALLHQLAINSGKPYGPSQRGKVMHQAVSKLQQM
jgi:hypothetical protein